MADTFQSRVSGAEEAFKASTVGLVSAEEFKRKRLDIESAELAAELAKTKAADKARKRKGREREAKLKALSFNMDDEEAEGAAVDGGAEAQTAAAAECSSSTAAASASVAESSDATVPAAKKAKNGSTSSSAATAAARSSGKDPLADTSFLPDRAREAEELALRVQLADEWRKTQEAVKQEQIQIVYSYWDGSGHRNKVNIAKGQTIGQFLEKARKDLVSEFHELRGLGGDGLMYIKEDLIIPHHYSFYDLIVTKARGKSGPLFHFDVHDDVRMSIDANVEKDESHAGKIVTKGYYERNKANFPASRWEVFDPTVVRDKYSIKGGEVRGAFAPK
jgi:protein FAM50